MKRNRREAISLLAGAAPALGMLSAAGTANPVGAQAVGQNPSQKIDTRIGTLEFTHDFANGYPTDATIEKLYDERDFQRACQAYLWSFRRSRSRHGSAVSCSNSARGTARLPLSYRSKPGAGFSRPTPRRLIIWASLISRRARSFW